MCDVDEWEWMEYMAAVELLTASVRFPSTVIPTTLVSVDPTSVAAVEA